MKIGLPEIILIVVIFAVVALTFRGRRPQIEAPTPVVRRRPAREVKADKTRNRWQTLLRVTGVCLIVAGAAMFLNSLGWLEFFKHSYAWGGIIIITGIGLLVFAWQRQSN
jgi:hypothetical protein